MYRLGRRLPECGLPYHPSDRLDALPRRLAAADEVEQRELELGGVFVSLRRRGFAWVAISRAAGLPLVEVHALARAYGRRVAVELFRDAPTADETKPGESII
jgi:hypothetical protein